VAGGGRSGDQGVWVREFGRRVRILRHMQSIKRKNWAAKSVVPGEDDLRMEEEEVEGE
jgi:hypothetical protein